MSRLLPIAIILFVLGFLPHLAFIFFSSGIGANGLWDVLLCGWSLATLFALVAVSFQFKPVWLLVTTQIILMALLLIQSFYDAPFYLGT